MNRGAPDRGAPDGGPGGRPSSDPALDSGLVRAGPVTIDLARHEVRVGEGLVDLTPLEFRLLAVLAERPGWVLSAEQLIERVWGYDSLGDTRVVAVHVSNLRRKIEEDSSHPRILLTVRGVGYKLCVNEDCGPAGEEHGSAPAKADEVCAAAALLGESFELPVLAAVLDVSPQAALEGLEPLLARGVVVPERDLGSYAFTDPSVRVDLEDELPYHRRLELHRGIVEALEAPLQAPGPVPVEHIEATVRHFTRSAASSQPPWVLRYGPLLADHCSSAGRVSDAIEVLRRVVGCVRLATGLEAAEWSRAAELAERLGDLLLTVPDFAGAGEAYELAMEWGSADGALTTARRARKAGSAHTEGRSVAAAYAMLARAEALLGERPPGGSEPPGTADRARLTAEGAGDADKGAGDADAWWAEWTEARLARMWLCYYVDDGQLPLLIEDTRRRLEAVGDPLALARFYQLLVAESYQRDRFRVTDEALMWCHRAHDILVEGGAPPDLVGFARFVLGFAYLWRGDLDLAEEHLNEAQSIARATGDNAPEVRILTYLAVTYRLRGDPVAAGWYAYRALRSAVQAGTGEYVSAAHANFAWIALRRGNRGAARENAEAALAGWAADMVAYPFEWLAILPLLEVELADAGLDACRELVERLLAPSQQRPPDDLEAACLRVREVAEARGGTDEVQVAVEEVCRTARELGLV